MAHRRQPARGLWGGCLPPHRHRCDSKRISEWIRENTGRRELPALRQPHAAFGAPCSQSEGAHHCMRSVWNGGSAGGCRDVRDETVVYMGVMEGERKMSHRKMPAYGEREHGGRYILDDYCWSRNHCRAVTIRRWKRNLKKKARTKTRMQLVWVEGGYEQDEI